MLSFASEADIPPIGFLSGTWERSGEDADALGGEDGDGALGFQASPPGFGRGAGAGRSTGVEAGLFSNAAILSRREPGFGFGGGG